jgi:ABC-type Mn2+/Zn2+ transport system ATPase subunit
MPLITLTNGGFRYPSTKQWIFRDLTLPLNLGDVIRITGRNGSGKSTLLKILSGILDLTEGTLRNDLGITVAYMDQFSGEMLAGGLTIAEQLKAATSPEVSGSIIPLATLAEFGIDLQNRLNAFVGYLSGGERQIVALLCTLASGAGILCLDEFSSALDSTSAAVAERLLMYANTTAHVTLIVVSHSGTTATANQELDISMHRR